jgi:sulfur-oxidizing protein SoxX
MRAAALLLGAGAACFAAAGAAAPASGAAEGLARYEVVGDAIPRPLADATGDPARGRALVTDRRVGMCLLCHTGPFPEERTPGNLATDLAGAGARWSEGQLRLRIVDARRLNPQSVMPAYHRTEGLQRVAAAAQGRPLLNAQQVEDVVAFLSTLQ